MQIAEPYCATLSSPRRAGDDHYEGEADGMRQRYSWILSLRNMLFTPEAQREAAGAHYKTSWMGTAVNSPHNGTMCRWHSAPYEPR